MTTEHNIPMDEIFDYLISSIEICLFELDEGRPTDREHAAFIKGERIAYVECLEMLQRCEKYKELGLDYDIEARYLDNR